MPKNIPAAVVHVPLKTRFAYPRAQLSESQELHRSSGLMIEILIVDYIDRVRASKWVSKVHFGNNANMSFSYRAAKSLDFGAEDCLHLSESGAPNANFRKISVRKTIWDLEFPEHFL